MPYTRLKQELDRLATNIWQDVTLVRSTLNQWRLGEVTVTEYLHLELLRSGLLTGMIQYNLPNEKLTGADWEWVIQVPGTENYLRYRIQAKIIESQRTRKGRHSLRFAELDHPRSNPGQQRKTLLSAAQLTPGWLPFYAFYIGNPWPTDEQPIPPLWATKARIPTTQFGCTAVPASAVEQIRTAPQRGKTFAANRYLAGKPGREGRRLSDLFPPTPSSPAGSQSISPPDGGPTNDWPAPNTNEITQLMPEETFALNQFQERSEKGFSPVITLPLPEREQPAETSQLRLTAFFTAR